MNGWNPGNDTTGAGGFLNTTANLDSPGGKKKETVRRLQSVVPVVVRQIRDHKEEDFKLFGFSAQIVSIVGILKDVDVQSTKASYTVEDHTGSMRVVWWLDNDSSDDTPTVPAVKEGSYVQVYGTLRVSDGDRTMIVLKMFPVEDANIITTHLLEVIHTRLQAEAMSKNSAQIIKQNNPGAHLVNSMSYLEDNTQNTADNGQPNMTAIQQKIYKIMQADNTVSGPSRASILNHFTSNQRREANEALEFLINEGHAYSTIDTDHFKPTDI